MNKATVGRLQSICDKTQYIIVVVEKRNAWNRFLKKSLNETFVAMTQKRFNSRYIFY